ncbi:16S rRNA (guanine(966)-N(2))-methyltransferase RsmD [Syntrophomonas erecta]
MRVITGRAKGKRLKAPTGKNTRPITDRIKEALFNIIGSDIEATDFLDLFAGSGSVGIEAISRGASRVIFVDSSNEAIKIIRENLANCGFDNNFEVHRNDVMVALERLSRREIKFDYIYVDPPFTREHLFPMVMRALDKIDILKDNGMVIIRIPTRMILNIDLQHLRLQRTNTYGESTLNYYRLS